MKSRTNLSVRNRSYAKRGYVVVLALAAMAVVAGFLLPLVPPALRARRQVRLEEIAIQGEFLTTAALQNALKKIEADGNYSGETISFSLPDDKNLEGSCESRLETGEDGGRILILVTQIGPVRGPGPHTFTHRSERRWKIPTPQSQPEALARDSAGNHVSNARYPSTPFVLQGRGTRLAISYSNSESRTSNLEYEYRCAEYEDWDQEGSLVFVTSTSTPHPQPLSPKRGEGSGDLSRSAAMHIVAEGRGPRSLATLFLAYATGCDGGTLRVLPITTGNTLRSVGKLRNL